MEDKTIETLPEKIIISSDTTSLTHEENTPSTNVSQPNLEKCDKKIITPDTDDVSTTTPSFAQDKKDAEKTEKDIDETFELRLELSDEDTIQDKFEAVGVSADIKDGLESDMSKKADTFFSDIESSDDSIGYEPKDKTEESVVVQCEEKEALITDEKSNVCKEKDVETEFDPVESDEEFFEDPQVPERKEILSQESISEEEHQWESQKVAQKLEEDERSDTPLIDEENNESNQPESTEVEEADSIAKEKELVDDTENEAVLLQEEELNAPMNTELIQNSVENPSKNSADHVIKSASEGPEKRSNDNENISDEMATVKLPENKIIQLDEEKSSEMPELMNDTSPVSASSLLFDDDEECPTGRQVSESSNHAEDILLTASQLAEESNSIKLEEAMLIDNSIIEDLEPTEDLHITSQTTNDPENTPTTSTSLKDETVCLPVQPMKSVVEVAKTPEVDESSDAAKMNDNVTQLEVENSCVTVGEQLEIEEPMEIGETLEASKVLQMETSSDEKPVKKTGNENLSKDGPETLVEEEKLLQESDELSEENEKLSDETNEEDIKSLTVVAKPVGKLTTDSIEIDEDKLLDLELSEFEAVKPKESVSSQDLVETDQKYESDRTQNSSEEVRHSSPLTQINDTEEPVETITDKESNKVDNSRKVAQCDPSKEDQIIETDEELIISSSVEYNKALNEKKQSEPTEKEIPGDGIEVSNSPEKSNKEKILDQTATFLDEQSEKENKLTEKINDADELSPQNIDKSLEISEKSNEPITDIQIELSEEIVQSSHLHLTDSNLNKESSNKILETNEKGDATVEDLKENIESEEVVKSSTKSSIDMSDSNEKKESSKETSEKLLADSTETKEPREEIVELHEKLDLNFADSNEKKESSKEIVDHDEKSEARPEDSTEKKESAEKNLEETYKSDKQDSIENDNSSRELVQSSIENDENKDISKETEVESIISDKETVTETIEKPYDEAENVSALYVRSPEVAAEIVVETSIANNVEGGLKDTKEADAVTKKDGKKPSIELDPEIIEIDDDDDVLQEEKKLKGSSETNKKDTSPPEKVLIDNKNDTATKTLPDKKDEDEKMDVDKELTAINIEKSGQKPKEEQNSNKDAKINQEPAVNDNRKSKSSRDMPIHVDDEEEPLLMIDTSHIEDNDNESNYMDNETATSAPSTDSSSDGSLEIFYDKECVNYECKRESKNFYRVTMFTMSYFKISKKRTKVQFVCEDCYDRALSSYEELCKTLKQKQPLLHGTTFKSQEFVEIIDSSDEEETEAVGDKVKDENTLPKESIEMLEAELEGAIRKVMQNVDIQNQLSWTKQILQQRLTNLQDDTDFVSDQLRALQKKADGMHNSLYQCPKIKLRQLTPLDLNSGRMYNPESENSTSIPQLGEVIRVPIRLNEQYYAVKTKAIASWIPCKVIEEVEVYPAAYNQTKSYKIKFTKLARYPMFKTVYAKHMAYYDPPNVRLPIGSRVIAYFDATSLSRGKEKMLIPSAFYPGIIAEPLKQSNKFRYLVFYDDGYFQYVNHKDVRLVCQVSDNVWEDVHHQSREFIHNYLTQYAVNRPMVQTQKGQSMLVDYNGKWIYARVIDVDCSLVQMLFEGQSRSEWIYRGSTRLGPVYKESNNLCQKNTLNATRRRTEPFIRYINGDDSSSSQQVQEPEEPQSKTGEIRAVAKKSVSRVDTSSNNTAPSNTAQPVPTVRHLNNSTIFVDDDNKPKGKVVYYTARKNLPPRYYTPHICNPSCPFNVTHNLSFYSPLAKPLLSGWERQVFRQKSKKFIVYRGPCGKRMRTIEELHRYLRVTDNELNVDNFDFSADTNCLAEYVLEKCLVNIKDISVGKEKMPIPCVNYYDDTEPPACEYSAVRIPTAGVPLNLNEDFMCGCDCEDDCSDKTKCACWELTYAGAKYGMPTVPTEMVGYQFKRLYEHVPTGIYECNSRCKCKANCVNRVVQQPLQSKLQVFKTSNRGWGLRCLNDVPRGSFICVYAGQMLTEQVANEGGLDAGDEYFAELDYIEVAEQIKEGYESDVQEPDEEEDYYNPERDDDDFDFRAPTDSNKDKEFTTRLRARRSTKNSTDGECESQERQVISFEPNKTMDTSNEPKEKPTIRKLFGKDESCYVMDAKVRGNLGRYFNHSCSPNLFVQNVFVDTHDLRFPWVAFFASTHIRAGTELTWNYNYEVGVVPGKVLYCQCGAPNCRQRLL